MEMIIESIARVYILTGIITAVIFTMATVLLKKGEIDIDADTYEEDCMINILKNNGVLTILTITIIVAALWPKIMIGILKDEQ